jgi:hypothetical protein
MRPCFLPGFTEYIDPELVAEKGLEGGSWQLKGVVLGTSASTSGCETITSPVLFMLHNLAR